MRHDKHPSGSGSLFKSFQLTQGENIRWTIYGNQHYMHEVR